jgi:hypothetical protein
MYPFSRRVRPLIGMTITSRVLTAIVGAAAMPLFAAEIAISGGIGPKHESTVRTPFGTVYTADSSGTVLLDIGTKLFGIGPLTINADVPIAFGGPGRAELDASLRPGGGIYTESMKWAFTPGLKARFSLGMLQPWISMGVGGTRLEQAGAEYSTVTGEILNAVTGKNWSFVMSPAGGIDFKPIPVLFLRGEVRTYTFRAPESFVGLNPLDAGNWRNNLLFLGGIGARF